MKILTALALALSVVALSSAEPRLKLTPAEVSSLETEYLDPSEATGSSVAVRIGDTPIAHTAQFLSLNSDERVHGVGNAGEQARKILQLIAFALKEVDTGMDQVVKLNISLREDNLVREVERVISKQFSGRAKPAVMYVTGELAHPNALVAMDAVATTSTPGSSVIQKFSSPAIYPMRGGSHVSILPVGSKIYISGQADNDGTVAASSATTLQGLAKTMEFVNGRWENVAQIKIFINKMDEVDDARAAVGKLFGGRIAPPLVFVEWKSRNPVEIELIVAGGDIDPNLENVSYITPVGMKTSDVFTRVTRINFGKSIYIGGVTSLGSVSAATQVREILSTVNYVVNKLGGDMSHLVKATYYVTDADASSQLNNVRREIYDPAKAPAASKAMVSGVGRESSTVSIDMIAVMKK